jgi:hypothetical protein
MNDFAVSLVTIHGPARLGEITVPRQKGSGAINSVLAEMLERSATADLG